VKGWFFGRQELNHYRREVPRLAGEVKRLELELAKQKEPAWAAGKVAGLLMRSGLAASGTRAHRPAPPPCDSFAGKPR